MRKSKQDAGTSKQFRWTKPMEHIFLEILAEEAKKGNKPSNVFKPNSLHRVASTISEKFNVTCESNHVENHLKTVKNTWVTISTIRGSSGFGWDDNLKMILADKKSYEEALEAHPKWEPYLNKKLEMYDEMALVAGKDLATGSFAKSFGDVGLEDKDTNMHEPIDVELEDDATAEIKGKASSSVGTSNVRSHRKRKSVQEVDEDDQIRYMGSQIGELANAIKKLSDESYLKDLYDHVMSMEGYTEDSLGKAYDYLVEHEKEGKAFIIKSKNLKTSWLQNFFAGLA